MSKKSRPMKIKAGISIAVLLVLGIVFSLFLRGTLRAMEVESGSMNPTIQKNDLLLTWYASKDRYQRGEIVILKSPDDDGSDLVKRVVAIPGDTIAFRDGKFLVNGEPSPPPRGENGPHRRTPDLDYTLSPSQYFVLGDNRSNSHDSEEFGPIDKELIHGRVLYRYGPLGRIGDVE